MQKQFPKILLPPFLIWVICPSSVFLRKVCPILYLLFLQTITGIPKPEALEGFDASEFAIQFSEKLYDYPFWLQDLSHLPLFFIFTWLAHWFFVTDFQEIKLNYKALIVSLFYAVFNEGIQAFIPDRFPSPGDLFMNLAGVATAFFLYGKIQKKISLPNAGANT